MELQRINKYPALNSQGQNPNHQLPAAQPTHPQLPHCCNPRKPTQNLSHPNYAPRQGITPSVGAQRPHFEGPMTHPHPNHVPTFPVYHLGGYPYQQMPPSFNNYSPEGYYISYPTQYLMPQPSPTYYHSNNEYYNENAYFTLPSENQNLTLKCEQLENEIQKYKCATYIHWTLIYLAAIGAILLGLSLIFISFLPAPSCHIVTGAWKCTDDYAILKQPWVLPVILGMIFYCLLVVAFHRYGLTVYYSKKFKPMNRMYCVYFGLLIVNVVTFHVVSIAIFGYLTYASDKLRNIFRELEETKAQMVSQTMETQRMM